MDPSCHQEGRKCPVPDLCIQALPTCLSREPFGGDQGHFSKDGISTGLQNRAGTRPQDSCFSPGPHPVPGGLSEPLPPSPRGTRVASGKPQSLRKPGKSLGLQTFAARGGRMGVWAQGICPLDLQELTDGLVHRLQPQRCASSLTVSSSMNRGAVMEPTSAGFPCSKLEAQSLVRGV